MAIVTRQISTVPDGGNPLDWLLVLCYYTQIPMYQIIRILQQHFRQPYDPVRTRVFYERMEEDMDGAYCRVVERGVDSRHTQGILEEAARERARIVEEEQARPRGRGRGR